MKNITSIKFPVGHIHCLLHKGNYIHHIHHLLCQGNNVQRVGAGTFFYLGAVMEYLATEILELAVNAARQKEIQNHLPSLVIGHL